MTAGVFFGWLLMIVGGLGALFSGGCAVYIIGDDVWRSMTNSYHHVDIAYLAIFVGGIPCILFLAFFRWGRRLAYPQQAQLPQAASGTSSRRKEAGNFFGYAFREMWDEIAYTFGSVGRMFSGKPPKRDLDDEDTK